MPQAFMLGLPRLSAAAARAAHARTTCRTTCRPPRAPFSRGPLELTRECESPPTHGLWGLPILLALTTGHSLQTRVDDWESIEKAGACMVVVAKEYCAGVLSKQGLLKRRDEIMQADPSVKKNKRKAAGATRQKPARAGEPVDGPPAEGAGQQGRGGSSGAPEEGACARWSVGKLSRPRMHGAAEEPQGSPQEASEAAAATAPVAACAAASTPAVAAPLGSRPAQVGPAQSLACVRRHAPGPAWDEVDDDFERLGF